MGQYYFGVILSDNDYENIKENKKMTCTAAYYTHDTGNGLKLMEHSYVGNDYVAIYEHLLSNEHKGKRLIWCGDYADDIRTLIARKEGTRTTRKKNEEKITAYEIGSKFNDEHQSEQKEFIDKMKAPTMLCRYLINYDKKEYVDLFKAVKNMDKWGCVIHPLPLLTCSGNGRGGGDYRGRNKRLVGSWALDHIGLARWDDRIDEEFKEITPNFQEKR